MRIPCIRLAGTVRPDARAPRGADDGARRRSQVKPFQREKRAGAATHDRQTHAHPFHWITGAHAWTRIR